jgi:sorbitol-specific phosphotransferase system component IIA
MMPVTSASMTEIGQSATGLLQGSWVIGFFRDGSNAQDPLVMGSIPSMSSTVDYQLGFTDPDERYPIQSKLDIAETPLAAKSFEEAYKNAFSYTKKKELRDTHDSVPTANAAHNNNWKFPDIDSVIAPQYPKNHVIAYEKADDAKEDSHIVEFDVTPGQERISTIHRTGTYHEITPTGDETTTIVGNEFKIVVKDQNVNVIGNCNLTVDSNCSTYIKGNWNIQVDGNVIENIGGSLTQNVTGDVKEIYTSNQKTAVSGNIDIDGARIDLN